MSRVITLFHLLLFFPFTLHAIQMEEISPLRSQIDYQGTSWSIAWRDFDNDGDPDHWASNHGWLPSLYINQGNGSFVKASRKLVDSAIRDGHAAAWADMDNDGDADLMEVTGAVLGSGKGANQLFKNERGVLRDIAHQAGVDYPLGRGRVPLWLDYDNDGFLDLLLMNQSRPDDKAPSVLFRNENGHFSEVTKRSGLILPRTANDTFALLTDLNEKLPMETVIFGLFPPPFSPRVYAVSNGRFLETKILPDEPISDVFDAVSGDFNGDLRPDLFLVRYRYSSTIATQGPRKARAAIYNNGASIRGIDIHTDGDLKLSLHLPTVKWKFDMLKLGKDKVERHPENIHVISGQFTFRATDAALHGRPIIDKVRNRAIYLWFNPRENFWQLRFTSQAWAFLQLEIESSSPISRITPAGFKVAKPLQPVLLLSTQEGYRKASLPELPSCSSTATADFDNDRDLDIYLVCTESILNRPNIFLENDGKANFSILRKHGAEGTDVGVGQKAAVADYDNDGYPDLFVINGLGPASPLTRGPYQLFHNLGGDNHWLKIKLEGVGSNRDGTGSQVLLTADEKTQLREQNGMSHYGAQDDIVLHFGLGDSDRVDRLLVLWPDGSTQKLENLPVDQTILVRQPASRAKLQ